MKRYISIACISIFLSSGSAAAENTNCLIVLTAESQAETQEAIKTIEYFGGEVRHVFVPDVLIGYVPPAIDQTIKERTFISMVVREELDVAACSYDIKASRLAISAWNHLVREQRVQPTDLPGGMPLVNDVHPSLHQLKSDEGESVDIVTVEEADKYTSCYMIGRVAVGIILMESNGDDENWTAEQECTCVSEIVQGLNWLSYLASEQEVNLSWYYEIHCAVPTSYEPIQGPVVPYYVGLPYPHHEFEWMDDALSHLGCSDGFQGMYQYCNRLRSQYQTDWAYMTFVVMDENDPDHMFNEAGNWFAYARLEGPYVVMTYNNDAWGPELMNTVFEHETGHIFGAPDEYENGCCSLDCVIPYGYLDVVNGNCMVCNPYWVPCIMRGDLSGWGFCDFSKGHLGWRDSDGDGPSDPIDPNSLRYANIPDSEHQLQPGDLVRIYAVDLVFVKSISVTPDNSMCCNPTGSYVTTWDGSNKVGGLVGVPQVFVAKISDQEEYTFTCFGTSTTTPVFSNINFSNGVLDWRLTESQARVRLKIYDDNDQLALYPIRDKVHFSNRDYETDIFGLVEGASYTAEFFGWLPQGSRSDTTEYSFTYTCNLVAPTATSVAAMDTCLNVEWADSNRCHLGYVLERKSGSDVFWSVLDTTGHDIQAYSDYQVVGSETYEYRVKAYTNYGSSQYSNILSKKARPFPPLNLFVENFYCNRDYRPIGKLLGGAEESKNFKLQEGDCIPPYPDSIPSDASAIYADYPVRQKPGTFAGMEVWTKSCHWLNHNVVRFETTFVELDRPMLIRTAPDRPGDHQCTDFTYYFKVRTVDVYGDKSMYWPPGEPGEILTWGWPYICCVGPCHVNISPSTPLFLKEAPAAFSLAQNYPNPFNPTTKIQFTLAKSGFVTLQIYDILGRKVRTLTSQHLSAGYKSTVWDGKNEQGKEVSSGIYLYRLTTEDFTETKRMVLLK